MRSNHHRSSSHGPRRVVRRKVSHFRSSRFGEDPERALRRVIETKSRMNRKSDVRYPSASALISLNNVILQEVNVSRHDLHLVWRPEGIQEAIEKSRSQSGDIYDKAAMLLVELQGRHPFKSGNKRTAFAAASIFLMENGKATSMKGDISKTMQGIREGFYSHEEIKEWIKGNGIREFNRFAQKEEWKGRN